MAIIRFNPTRAPAEKPIATGLPTMPVKNIADRVHGSLYAHLGHFGQRQNLVRGHNSNGHPGFAAVQDKIAHKEGVSKKAAGAILANSSRHASAAAKKHNPRLKRVKG